MKILLMLLTLISFNVTSTELIISGLSHHFTKGPEVINGITYLPYDYNERNYGVGFEYNNYEVLLFKNSYHDTSLMLAYNLRKNLNDYVSVGVRFGGASGYSQFIRPFAIPNVTVWVKRFVEVSYIPDITGDLYGTLTLNGRVRF